MAINFPERLGCTINAAAKAGVVIPAFKLYNIEGSADRLSNPVTAL